jgi:hypothetical protein
MARPVALPPGKTRCPWYRRLAGPQGQSGRLGKIWSSPEFDSILHKRARTGQKCFKQL